MVHIDRDPTGEPILPADAPPLYAVDQQLHVILTPRPRGHYWVRNTAIRFSLYLHRHHFLPRYRDILYPPGTEADATPHLRTNHPTFSCTLSQRPMLIASASYRALNGDRIPPLTVSLASGVDTDAASTPQQLGEITPQYPTVIRAVRMDANGNIYLDRVTLKSQFPVVHTPYELPENWNTHPSPYTVLSLSHYVTLPCPVKSSHNISNTIIVISCVPHSLIQN